MRYSRYVERRAELAGELVRFRFICGFLIVVLVFAMSSLAATVGLAEAASAGPIVPHQATPNSRTITGKLRSATKRTMVVTQKGAKSSTTIRLDVKTQYFVNGKRVSKEPAFIRGTEVKAVISASNLPYRAQVVMLGSATSGTLSHSSSGPLAAGAMALAGAVTLTSLASVTLQTASGTQTIKLTPATRYIVQGKLSGLKPILHAGERVTITAVQSHGAIVGQTFTVP